MSNLPLLASVVERIRQRAESADAATAHQLREIADQFEASIPKPVELPNHFPVEEIRRVAQWCQENSSGGYRTSGIAALMLLDFAALRNTTETPVAYRWRSTLRPHLPWNTTTDASVIKQLCAEGSYEVEPLITAGHSIAVRLPESRKPPFYSNEHADGKAEGFNDALDEIRAINPTVTFTDKP